jgi:ubiquinone/menaquinone biosynthesis C-methylase UbiE
MAMQDRHHETIYNTEISHFWYRVRRNMTHDFIRKYFEDRKNLNILDVGCGTGALLRELNQYGKVQGLDFSPRAVSFCKERGLLNVEQGSATDIRYENNTFDLVLALDILEHIDDDKKAMAEIHRVLKPGGVAIIFVPTFMFLWGITDKLSQHFRRYTLRELRTKTSQVGFSTIRASYFNTFLFLPIALLRIFVRIFNISIKSENELGSPTTNEILYGIFNLERKFLKFMNFPFGVSGVIICQKK